MMNDRLRRNKTCAISTNDDDDESNTDELTMFMLVCVSTMSGATNGYFWSGTLRFSPGTSFTVGHSTGPGPSQRDLG